MEDLDEFIIENVTTRIPILKKIDPDKLYKSGALCAEFWKEFKGHHTVIGKRIKWLSKNNRLPIIYIGTGPDNGALYKLK